MNRFEQFCINYTNEKIQKFSTDRLIYKEQQWYKSEGLDLPVISFPGNEGILGESSYLRVWCLSRLNVENKMYKIYIGLLEHKTFGIFQLLDDECKLKQPNLGNFMLSVSSRHKDCKMLSTLTTSLSNRAKTEQEGFVIRHFARNVHYTTVRYFRYQNNVHSLPCHV